MDSICSTFEARTLLALDFEPFLWVNAETLDATVFTDNVLTSIDSSRSGILGTSEADVAVD